MSIIQLSELLENYNELSKSTLANTIIQLSELLENYNKSRFHVDTFELYNYLNC